MKSKVYFISVKDSKNESLVAEKLKKLLQASKILDVIRKDNKVAVKIHFGEEGNTGFVRPQYARVVCDIITGKLAIPVLSDTNTLYHGKRSNSKDHIRTAAGHGFTEAAVGARIVIPDEAEKNDVVEMPSTGRILKKVNIARLFVDADAIVAINHFKGHILTGFGGALKNIGMGCATRPGKLAQHCDASPVVHADQCTGCGECVNICPADAIRIENAKSVIDRAKCIGCADCILVCPTHAMFIDFKAGSAVQDKMVEYAAALLKPKKNKAAFLNFAVKIHKECDCWYEETPLIAPDVGILASLDPVAIDKASYDLVKKACGGKDVFKEVHPEQDGTRQLKYAEEIGLGSSQYELVEVG